MANKDMERLVISGLDANNYILTPDTTLSKDGVPADAGAVGDALEEVSEDIEGVQEDLSTLNTEGTVPTSEQMLSENVTVDSVPYHFRKTASDNADREELEIVGGSVAWNQLVAHGNFDEITGWSGRYSTVSVENNIATVTPESDGTDRGIRKTNSTAEYAKAGHKYLFSVDVKSPIDSAVSLSFEGVNGVNVTVTAGVWVKCCCIWVTSSETNRTNPYALLTGTVTTAQSIQYKNFMIVDLTQALGTTIADHIYALEQATAGAGVALFRSLFPKDYYAYDAGSMQSVSGLSEHRTVGKNLIDAEDSYSVVYDTTWINVSCHLLPGTYTFSFSPSVSTGAVTLNVYNKDNVRIHYNNVITNASHKATFTITEEATKITSYSNSALTISDVQIECGSEATAYEPYESHSYPLDSSLTLRGIPTLVDGKIKFDGDIYSPSGAVEHKYGEVVLNGTQPTGVFASGVSGEKLIQVIVTGLANVGANDIKVISDKLVSVSENTIWTNAAASIATHGEATAGNRRIWLRVGTTITTDSEAVTWLQNNPVTVVYPLATPTTEQADPYVSPQICHADGTEEFVSTGIVPIGHNTKYPDNLRMKLDGLPWNFASLIAPTESGFTATRNYTSGALLIVNNVLYKATANIANGGTITPNTNVTATTLAEVIAAL